MARLWRVEAILRNVTSATIATEKTSAGAKFFGVLCVSIGYTPAMAAKDSGLRIRVERPLREAFVAACRKDDKPAAQVIREFMRGYVARHTPDSDAAVNAKWDRQPARSGNRVGR